jgi:hypothetical protein
MAPPLGADTAAIEICYAALLVKWKDDSSAEGIPALVIELTVFFQYYIGCHLKIVPRAELITCRLDGG